MRKFADAGQRRLVVPGRAQYKPVGSNFFGASMLTAVWR